MEIMFSLVRAHMHELVVKTQVSAQFIVSCQNPIKIMLQRHGYKRGTCGVLFTLLAYLS